MNLDRKRLAGTKSSQDGVTVYMPEAAGDPSFLEELKGQKHCFSVMGSTFWNDLLLGIHLPPALEKAKQSFSRVDEWVGVGRRQHRGLMLRAIFGSYLFHVYVLYFIFYCIFLLCELPRVV